jgi:hypothetical protein
VPGISRRKFTQIISTAGIAGTALLEKMYAEAQSFGYVSHESVRSFLDLSGMKVQDDQIASLQTSLERALEGMRRIRDRNVPQTLEPVVAFRVRR